MSFSSPLDAFAPLPLHLRPAGPCQLQRGSWVAGMAPPPPCISRRGHQPRPITQGIKQANSPNRQHNRIAAVSRAVTAREKVQHIHRQSPASAPTQKGSDCRAHPENNNAMRKLLNPEKRQVRHYLQEYAVQAVYRLMIMPSCYQYKRTSTFMPGVTACTTPSSYPSKTPTASKLQQEHTT